MEYEANSKHYSVRIQNFKYSHTPSGNPISRSTAVYTEMEDTARHACIRITRTSFCQAIIVMSVRQIKVCITCEQKTRIVGKWS